MRTSYAKYYLNLYDLNSAFEKLYMFSEPDFLLFSIIRVVGGETF